MLKNLLFNVTKWSPSINGVLSRDIIIYDNSKNIALSYTQRSSRNNKISDSYSTSTV